MQAEVDRWISQFEEGYWHPLSQLARLTEEVGELGREINHRFGEKPKKPEEAGGKPGAFRDRRCPLHPGHPCQLPGIDLERAFREMMGEVPGS